MNVGQLCSRDVVNVADGASLDEVARLMRDRHVGAIVVVKGPAESRTVAGFITDRDIVHAQLARMAELSQVAVADVMSLDPLILCEDEPVDAAIDRMRTRGVRRAPVVSASGALTGVVSTDDLIAHVAWELGTMARAIERQPRLERTAPGT